MSTAVTENQNRRVQRIVLPLPTRVDVRINSTVSWNEITRLSDVSAFGAGFSLKRPVKRGRLVLLTLPMPRQLRCYDFSEPQYRIWGLVRRCLLVENAKGEKHYAVGVAFIGKNTPQCFSQNPAKLYDLSRREEKGLWKLGEADTRADDTDLPSEMRRQTRFPIPETIKLELMDDAGTVTTSETTVTENISLSGAAVFTALDIEPGTFLRVSSERSNAAIISIVRGKRKGADGMTRLHLEFIDDYFPLDGVV